MAPFGLISQDDYYVHVVGHDNEGVQINAMVMCRQVIPSLLRKQICCAIVPIPVGAGFKPAPTDRAGCTSERVSNPPPPTGRVARRGEFQTRLYSEMFSESSAHPQDYSRCKRECDLVLSRCE